MNYTTNYHLPQWVEEDRIMMTDFNEAMERIEEGMSACYGDGRKPAAWTTFALKGSTGNGTTLAEFDFAPAFVILGSTQLYCVLANDSSVMTLTSGIYEYRITVRLSGTSLILSSNDSDLPGTYTLSILAFR